MYVQYFDFTYLISNYESKIAFGYYLKIINLKYSL